jgi:Protein of unknown function (DUF2442)
MTADEARPRAVEVAITDDDLSIVLADGRGISVPLTWFPRLLHATPAQRQHFEFLGDGEGFHWPDVDEDLSVAGLLRGTPAPQSRAVEKRSGSISRWRRSEP